MRRRERVWCADLGVRGWGWLIVATFAVGFGVLLGLLTLKAGPS